MVDKTEDKRGKKQRQKQKPETEKKECKEMMNRENMDEPL